MRSIGLSSLTAVALLGTTCVRLTAGPGAPEPPTVRDVTYIELPRGIPQDVAVGKDAVWVATRKEDDGNILRVDPETGEVIEVITVDGHHPNRLAAAGSIVWATTGGEGSGTILKVDAVTSELVEIIPVEGGPQEIAIVNGEPWVQTLLPLDEGRIMRLDPDTSSLSVAARLDQSVSDLAAGEGAVWAITGGGEEGWVVKIDPYTGEALATLNLDNPNYWNEIAAAEGSIWVASQVPKGAGNDILREEGEADLKLDGVSIMRIDPISVQLEGDPVLVGYGYFTMGVGAGAVWVWNGLSEVSELDPRSGLEVATIPVRDGGRLAVGFGAVWVAGTRSLVRVSL